MPNATTRDSRAGWDIYFRANAEISRDDLNTELSRSGYNRISPRTMEHYRRLFQAGYTRYISINRFDLSRASDPYEVVATSGRYPYRDTDTGIQAIFAKGRNLFQASGRAVEIADVGAVLRFSDAATIQGLRTLRPSADDDVSIHFLELGRSVSGTIVDVDFGGTETSVEVQYSKLVSIAEIAAAGEVLPTSPTAFVLVPSAQDDGTFDLVGKRIFHFFELVESIRTLVNAAGASAARQVYAEPPIVQQLSVASPTLIIIELATAARHLLPVELVTASLLGTGKLIDKRKSWYEGSIAKEESKQAAIETEKKKESRDADRRLRDAIVKKAEAEANEAEARVDNASEIATQETRIKRAEAELKEAEAEAARSNADIKEYLLEHLQAVLPDNDLSKERAEAIIDQSVQPALRKLADAGILEIQETDPSSRKKTARVRRTGNAGS